MNVLLIKAEREPREIITLVLEQEFKCKVSAVAGSQEGLDKLLDEANVDLIICDDDEKLLKLFKYLSSLEAKIPAIVIKKTAEASFLGFPEIIMGSIGPKDLGPQLKTMVQGLLDSGKLKETDNPEEYVRINVILLTRLVPLQCDVHIRLSHLKFVKIFSRGDHFGSAELEAFLIRKKIEYLYLHKDDAAAVASRMSADLDKVIAEPNVSPKVTAGLAASVHEAVAELSSVLGFDPEVEELAKRGVSMAIKSIGTNPQLMQILSLLNREKEKYLTAHSMLLAQISCTLSAAMSWPSGGTFQKLAFAAFFHDISLKNQEIARIKTLKELEPIKSKFTDGDVAAYTKHPVLIAELLRKFKETPPDVDTIIIQHHERPDGSGFPRGVSGTFISPLSCLFIIAHDFVDYLFESGEKPDIKKFFTEAKKIYTGGNFRKTLEAMNLDKVGGIK